MIKDTFYGIIEVAWPSLVIFLTIVILVRVAYLTNNNTKIVFHKELFMLLFVTYVLMLFELVTYTDVAIAGTNFIPFTEILRYDIKSTLFFNQVIGNILLFIPFGYFVSALINIKKILSVFVMTLITSSTIEIVQYFIGRSFDVDDIILNVLGGVLGFIIYVSLSAVHKQLPKIFRKDWFLNTIVLAIIIYVVLYLTNIIDIGWL